MITVPLIDWQPIANMPEDRKDGRQMLLWDREAVAARWNPDMIEYGLPRTPLGTWDTGFTSGDLDDPETVASPSWWADINPPA